MKEERNFVAVLKIFSSGVLKNILINLCSFVYRTVFIYYLSKDLLGVNSAVNSILNVLSLTELGVGTSFIYILYSAIANRDISKINSIMRYFKKIYRRIGLLILGIGIFIIPFLDILITAPESVKVYIIPCYCIMLLQTSFSYFVSAYKRCLLMADRKEYVVNNILIIVSLISCVINILVIIIFKNYIASLIINLLSIIVQNIIIANVVQNIYPYLNTKTASNVPKNIKVDITNSVRDIMLVKMGQMLYKTSDNIIISKFLGVATLALYDNYNLVGNSIQLVVSMIVSSFASIIGNLAVKESKERIHIRYRQLEFVTVFLFTIVSICYMNCIQPFVKIWIGNKYVMSNFFAILFAVRMFIFGINSPLIVFKDSLGLFKYGRILAFITGGVNIIFSIIFLKHIGVEGVLLSSVICDLFIYYLVHPYAVVKKGMEQSLLSYYKRYVKYWSIFIFSVLLSRFVINNIVDINGLIQFILNGIITILIVCLMYYFTMRKSDEYIYIMNFVKKKFLEGR